MFVLQKQLTVLNVPISRVAMLYCSGADIQLALPGLPPQMGSAFMVMLKGGGKVQVLVGLHMAQSCCNVFYVSDSGEVPVGKAEQELEGGLVFAESMGFILNDSELGRMTAAQQELYWAGLPICQKHNEVAADAKTADAKTADAKTADAKTADAKTADAKAADAKAADAALAIKLQAKRKVLKEHLGNLLASL